MLAVVYLTLVWSLSFAIRKLESRLALPEAADESGGVASALLGPRGRAGAVYVLVAFVVDWPDWAEPVARYILTVGLPATLRVSAIAVVGSCLIGIARNAADDRVGAPRAW